MLLVNNVFLFISILVVFLLYYVRTKIFISGNVTELYNKELFYYECGFDLYYFKYGFSLQYFIIRLSFMLFDLEICLFLPIIFSMYLGGTSFMVGVSFIVVLLLIFIYELYLGVVG